jgi:hypothetical protein
LKEAEKKNQTNLLVLRASDPSAARLAVGVSQGKLKAIGNLADSQYCTVASEKATWEIFQGAKAK